MLHVVPSLSVRAGMASVVMNYHRAIDRDAVAFDYLCINPPGEREQEARSLGARVWYVPLTVETRFGSSFFRAHAGEFDIVHCHPIFAAQLVGRAARRWGARAVIAHSHSTRFSEKPLSAARNSLLSWFVGVGATNYVACSEGARALLRLHGKDAYIMRNAIDPDAFRFREADRRRVRAELGIDDETLLLGTLGRCSHEKNQVFLLDVARSLGRMGQRFRIVIAGDGPLKGSLDAQIAARNMKWDVAALGSRSDSSALYSALDCFLLPSLFEGVPVSAVEAQASGLPCLLSDVVARDVAFGEVSFLPLDDPDAWARAAVESCGRRAPARERLVTEAGFDVREEATKLLGSYERILRE